MALEATSAGRRIHVVHFYDSSAELVATAGAELAAAAADGHSVIVVASKQHRDGFATALDVTVAVDAAGTLAQFMVDGRPDPVRFDEVIGELVRDVAADGRPITAYGEMVGLLWEAGNVNAAIELEDLWNDLATRVPFSLVCAYPRDAAVVAETHVRICCVHTHMAGQQSFERAPTSPRAARDFVAQQLRAWKLDRLIDDARLAVTELATNAVNHARTDFVVSITKTPQGVRVIVRDGSTEPPVVQDPTSTLSSGRGLTLASMLAADWGYEVTGEGKCVWLDLR